MKKVIKTVSIAFLIMIVLGGAATAGYFYFTSTEPTKVTTNLVEKGEIVDVVSSSGKVEANRTIGIMAEATDTVTEILVSEGNEVTQDQELIRFETADAVLSPIAGVVVDIQAEIDQTVISSTTQQVPSTTPTPSTDTGAQTPTDTGTQQQMSAQDLGAATSMTSAAVGTTLLTIADMNPTYIVVNVDETDIARVSVGQQVNIFLDSYADKELKGEITEIGLIATVTQAGGTAFPVKVKVTDAKGVVLRIGMSSDADIVVTTKQDAVRVPVESVMSEEGDDIVYVVKGSNATRKVIKLGILSGDYYEVTEGIAEGEEVVTDGLDKLKGFAKVTVKARQE